MDIFLLLLFVVIVIALCCCCCCWVLLCLSLFGLSLLLLLFSFALCGCFCCCCCCWVLLCLWHCVCPCMLLLWWFVVVVVVVVVACWFCRVCRWCWFGFFHILKKMRLADSQVSGKYVVVRVVNPCTKLTTIFATSVVIYTIPPKVLFFVCSP